MAAPTDVLVVGAGPAGSVAALVLARAGVRVQLVDRAVFPRHKLCGDTINPGSLALLDRIGLGAAVRAAGLPVRGMTVTGPGGAHVAATYPDGMAGTALTRRVFDQVLLEAAVASGATFGEHVNVRGAIVEGDHVAGIEAMSGSCQYRMPARVVIAADGRASRLGSVLGLTSFAARPRRWAFGAYFQGVAGLSDQGEMHVREDGYVGIAPLAGGIANVCVVREITGLRPGASLKPRPSDSSEKPHPYEAGVIDAAIDADPSLCARFVSARRVSDVTVLGPLAVEARSSGCPGLLLAGDAAGFVDPMTGDGLRFALRGGMLAAEHAMRQLDTGIAQHDALHAARRHEFSAKWRVNRALRALVASPRSVALAATVARRWDTPVRALVAVAGDVRLARDVAGQGLASPGRSLA